MKKNNNKLKLDRVNFFESIADEFENLDNKYDVTRRLEVIFDELLADYNLSDLKVLDAGCGYGAFTTELVRKGAKVTALDISEKLVNKVMEKTKCDGMVANACDLSHMPANSYDLIVSSEMIEHTISPAKVISELCNLLKPGGIIVVTTPNKVWQPVVRLAAFLHLRNFDGLENFPSWNDFENYFKQANIEILEHVGLHAWPFQLGLHSASRWFDHKNGKSFMAKIMINQAILGIKPN